MNRTRVPFTTNPEATLWAFYVECPWYHDYGSIFGEPPESFLPCGIYIAETRGRAKRMLVDDHNLDFPDDFLAARTRRLGRANRREEPGRVSDRSRWWGRAPTDPIIGNDVNRRGIHGSTEGQ